ncbi:MAG TPA: hypothetical protein PLG15_07355 [Candidatus Gastranaerophilaceae bacterium]|nr:hypothetical protein [Candidatus Gastranaerophilaceae bacterium]HPT42185.1 hypothetical protein [Candidatus Gastranaerophilaceae bacterium]
MEIQSINSAESGFANYDNLEPNDKASIQKSLQNLGIPLIIINSSARAIKTYATEHGINLKSISARIDAMIKEQQAKTPAQTPQKDFEDALFLSGIPQEIINKGQNSIERYAKEKGIELPKSPDGTAFNKSF